MTEIILTSTLARTNLQERSSSVLLKCRSLLTLFTESFMASTREVSVERKEEEFTLQMIN